ncbi:MAG: hypothetical protein K8U57_37500 [Planctomycetes bacterium]|nr:hypothetical protein [Planctomycetota bacterium]
MSAHVTITRREAFAVAVGAVVAGKLVAAPVPKTAVNPSWVGKTVMPRKHVVWAFQPLTPAENPSKPDDPTPQQAFVLDCASYSVKDEKGTRVEILDSDGTSGWVEKIDLILPADAVEFFTKALKENEKDTFAIISRGWAYHLLEKPKNALEDFDVFLKLTPAKEMVPEGTPRRWEGLVNRGLVLAEQGEFEKGFVDLDEAVNVRPHIPTAHVNHGYANELRGEFAKAFADYDAIVNFYNQRPILSENNKAWIHATCPEAKYRDGIEAVKLAKAVCERTKEREGMYLDTLAAAYAEAGKFDDAVKTQEKALEDKSYVIRYGEGGQKRLQLYKDKKPFRTEPVKK